MIPKIKEYRGHETNFIQLKYDGIRLDGIGGRWYTRHPTDVTDKVQGVQGLHLPPDGIAVWGELYVPGQPASAVSSYLAKGRQAEMAFKLFACTGIPAEASLHELQVWAFDHAYELAPFWAGRGWAWRNPEQFWIAAAQRFPDSEGLVFKHHHLYHWYKWKPVLTADVIVVDVKVGEGKFAGLVGGLVCAVEGQVVANVGTGIDDALRQAMTDEWMAGGLVGRVAEVAYQYVGSGGKLRHPRFVRWRTDKPADQCLLDQFF